MQPDDIIAVDIGNTRIKLARFSQAPRPGILPQPTAEASLPIESGDWGALEAWRAANSDEPRPRWWISSVNRAAQTRLLDWLGEHAPRPRVALLSAEDLPLRVSLERPDMVGIDRLLAAVAANHLRRAGAPAVVVGLGSAITVNFVSAAGDFLGGAILPGIAMSARAMHDYTDLLPLVNMQQLEQPPPIVGQATEPAMRAGLFWGAVGGVRELVARFAAPGPPPDVFLTGGAAAAVAELIAPQAQFVPHLTLSGIAITAQHVRGLAT